MATHEPQPAKRINFTKDNINTTVLPHDGRRYVYDSKAPGLALCLPTA